MGQILRIGFDLMETNFFGQTSETGQIIPKTVFFHKLSFSGVEAFSWKLSKKSSLSSLK